MKRLALLLTCLVSPVLAVGYLLVAQLGSTPVTIKRFNATTGAFNDNFIASAVGVLGNPRGMTVEPDGSLYVAESAANRVTRFSMVDGSFLGDFTPADLLLPSDLKFLNRDLYVVGSSMQRQIRRYNGSSGKYVRTVVTWASNQIGGANGFQSRLFYL